MKFEKVIDFCKNFTDKSNLIILDTMCIEDYKNYCDNIFKVQSIDNIYYVLENTKDKIIIIDNIPLITSDYDLYSKRNIYKRIKDLCVQNKITFIQ